MKSWADRSQAFLVHWRWFDGLLVKIDHFLHHRAFVCRYVSVATVYDPRNRMCSAGDYISFHWGLHDSKSYRILGVSFQQGKPCFGAAVIISSNGIRKNKIAKAKLCLYRFASTRTDTGTRNAKDIAITTML